MINCYSTVMRDINIKTIFTIIVTLAATAFSDPVIITGKDVPRLLGKSVASIVVVNKNGDPIPFQIDEVTKDGEYVLDKGESPNASDGNGVLDKSDEIVFLWDDADSVVVGVNNSIRNDVNVVNDVNDTTGHVNDTGDVNNTAVNDTINNNRVKNNTLIDGINTTITVTRGNETRSVRIVAAKNSPPPRSPKSYILYNHETGRVATPYYYADFAKDRFHFVKAGVMDFAANKFVDLTNELRVEILLKTLFGLIPIRYGENDLYCFVRRYKTGPIRLIRRGDFHLNLGLGIKGSRAAVNQICYPRAVKVPVYVNMPIRFRTLFSQAHIEMTPVIRDAGRRFGFAVPSGKLYFPLGNVNAGPTSHRQQAPQRMPETVDKRVCGCLDADSSDWFCQLMPLRRMFTLTNGDVGYGWILDATMQPEHISGSGFILRRPGTRKTGIAECGFRLTVRDVPKGNYYITNWVLFSGGKPKDIEKLRESLMERDIIRSD